MCENLRVRRRRWALVAVGYFLLALFSLIWPVFPAVGNTIEPRVFGVPWSLAYNLLVVVANTGVLVALYLSRSVDAGELDDDAGEPSPKTQPEVNLRGSEAS